MKPVTTFNLPPRAGIRFLQSTREFRQNDRLSSKAQFIFTGPIGLGNIIKKIGQTNLKERFKPVYYALMHRMQDEYPRVYKKMG